MNKLNIAANNALDTEINELPQQLPKAQLSDEHNKKVEKIIKQTQNDKPKMHLKRGITFVLIAAIIASSAIIAFGNKDHQNFDIKTDDSSITFEKKEVYDVKDLVVNIDDEYELVNSIEEKEHLSKYYENTLGDKLSFSKYGYGYCLYSYNKAKEKVITLDDITYYCSTSETEDEYEYYIFYEKNYYMYAILYISKTPADENDTYNELIEMSKNID